MGTETIEKVNLAAAFNQFQDRWSPKIGGEVSDSYKKLVRQEGELIR